MARKRIIATKTKTKPAKAAAAPVKAAPAKKAATVSRPTHNLKLKYAGSSTTTNRRKSRTVLPVKEFNTRPDLVLTERTEDMMKALQEAYGKSPFPRADADSGVLKFLLWKGFLSHVDGNPAHESCTFKFTPASFPKAAKAA